MKTARRFPLPGLILLIALGCVNPVFAQPEPQSTLELSAEDIKSYIANAKESGGRFGFEEEKYVLDNFGRPELTQKIDNWQTRKKTRLSKEIRIMVVVDYLLTEMRGMNVVPSVLDSISKGQSTSVGKEIKTQVAGPVTREYRAANIEIQINVDVVDVAIDDKSLGRARNKDMFVVVPAKPHIVVMTSGSRNCTQTVTPEAGKVVTVPCSLN